MNKYIIFIILLNLIYVIKSIHGQTDVNEEEVKKDCKIINGIIKKNENVDCCSDSMVICSEIDTGNNVIHKRVISLKIISNDFHGTLPAEIGNLEYLNILILKSIKLSGSIPKEIGNLTNLETLELMDNNLDGSIPIEIKNLTKLKKLDLSNNKLTGSIPLEIGNLTNLETLNLFKNKLSGSIPKELGQLTNLTQLQLQDNELSGTIPPELGKLSKLTIIKINNNEELCGQIPPEFEKVETKKLNIKSTCSSNKTPTITFIIVGICIFVVCLSILIFIVFKNKQNKNKNKLRHRPSIIIRVNTYKNKDNDINNDDNDTYSYNIDDQAIILPPSYNEAIEYRNPTIAERKNLYTGIYSAYPSSSSNSRDEKRKFDSETIPISTEIGREGSNSSIYSASLVAPPSTKDKKEEKDEKDKKGVSKSEKFSIVLPSYNLSVTPVTEPIENKRNSEVYSALPVSPQESEIAGRGKKVLI